jgi:hypothetical protein
MRRVRLAGLLLFAIGLAVLLYNGIELFAFNVKASSNFYDLELIGFAFGMSGALLFRLLKEPEMK